MPSKRPSQPHLCLHPRQRLIVVSIVRCLQALKRSPVHPLGFSTGYGCASRLAGMPAINLVVGLLLNRLLQTFAPAVSRELAFRPEVQVEHALA